MRYVRPEGVMCAQRQDGLEGRGVQITANANTLQQCEQREPESACQDLGGPDKP